MAKEVAVTIKLQASGGQATPAPPIGPALGQKQVNIMDFCKQFNSRTEKDRGMIVPVVITVYKDKSFSKTPPAPILIKKAAKIESGSGEPNRNKVGNITRAQVREIAELKMKDLNANTVEMAMRMVEGTCRSMGVTVSD